MESSVSNKQPLETGRMMQTNECAFIAGEPQGVIITVCVCVSLLNINHTDSLSDCLSDSLS